MFLRKLLLPAAALSGAILLLPPTSPAFSLLGGSLGLNQRHVRVFNNFSDASANDNTTPDPNFPGYVGAELAVWKGAAEWGSRPHGPTGAGDPTQSTIGDGGANFDSSWQGLASGPGGLNGNVVSQIGSNDDTVLAFMEGGFTISDGWRIRFIESPWNWQDGPDTFSSGNSNYDIQGIMVHEYGHALGLGHTNSNGATMRGSALPLGLPNRSIESDDIAGIQAIYGVALASKPIIDGFIKCGSELTIDGSGFAATGLEVWFTKSQAGGGAPGSPAIPVKVTDATSANGTQIVVTIPDGAGSGDILVKNPGDAFADLSNAWPIDIDLNDESCGPLPQPIPSFCFGDGGSGGCTPCPCGNDAPAGSAGGCENSSGTWGILLGSGTQSVSEDSLRFDLIGATTSTFAILSSADNRLPNAGAASGCPVGSGITDSVLDGLRCIGGSLIRHGTRATDAAGNNSNPWGPPGGPPGGLIASGGFVAGQIRHFQVFYRDLDTLGCGTGQNTSNGLSVTFIP